MRTIKILFLCLLCFLPISVQAIDLDLDSKYAILINQNENHILYEKEADKEVEIASLTKIMTAWVAIEQVPNLENKVIITKEMLAGLIEADASVAGFQIGEEVTYLDLLYGTILPSGADATRALAFSISGSEEAFVGLMNKKAQELGLSHTKFVNTSGLDSKGHYSTVREVAKILQESLKNETFYKIFTAKFYQTSNKRLTFQSTLQKSLTKYNLEAPYILGAKTGSTDAAGLCLASIAEKEGITYLFVTVGATNSVKLPYHIMDAIYTYEYYFDHFGYYPIIKEEEILTSLKVQYSNTTNLDIKADKTIEKYLPKDIKKEELEYVYHGAKLVSPFTQIGKKLGVYQILYHGDPLYSKEIVMPNSVSFHPILFLEQTYYIPLGFVALLLMIITVRYKKRRRRKCK